MSALNLPSLTVEAKAELITNNLPAFEAQFRKGIEGLKYELLTDGDFTKAKDDIKALKAAEKTISAVDQEIVNGSADIKALRESLATLGAEARSFRLSREKEVKQRDEKLKDEIVNDAVALIEHPSKERFRPSIAEAIKGKKLFSSMKDSAETKASEILSGILRSRVILDNFQSEHSSLLIPDRVNLELEDCELVTEKLASRLEKQKDEQEKAKLEEKARKAEEETAKAKAKEKPVKDLRKDFPDPPKIDSIPVGNAAKQAGETPEEEMDRFVSIVEASFAPVKSARAGLNHLPNIAIADAFAKSLGAAWVQFKNSTQ